MSTASIGPSTFMNTMSIFGQRHQVERLDFIVPGAHPPSPERYGGFVH